MAHLFRTLAVLPVVHVVNSAWTCPSGWNDKTGVPTCAGAVDSTCSNTQCCDIVPTCSGYSGWVLSGGCTAAGDTKFFDLKKTDVEVAAPQGEAEVKAACCTPFADAQCSDWNLMGCPIGKSVVGTNSAPADSSNGMGLSQAKYTELCCVDPPKMCSAYSVGWSLSQGLGGGCAEDTKFFDLKKTDVEVAAPQGEAEVKAACCTPFANAQCSDWTLMGGCPSGKYLLETNSAPADSSDGKVLSNDKFKELCCVDPMKCADYTGEMNSVSQTAASLVVFVLAITAVMAHAL